MKNTSLILFAIITCYYARAQNGNASEPKKTWTKSDSLYLARMNNSGNLMIGGGVALTGAGGYLIWQGLKIYHTNPVNGSSSDKQRNQRQGIIYMAAGGAAIAGGIVLVALGASNKITFKNRKRLMQLQSGFLDTGSPGLALHF